MSYDSRLLKKTQPQPLDGTPRNSRHSWRSCGLGSMTYGWACGLVGAGSSGDKLIGVHSSSQFRYTCVIYLFLPFLYGSEWCGHPLSFIYFTSPCCRAGSIWLPYYIPVTILRSVIVQHDEIWNLKLWHGRQMTRTLKGWGWNLVFSFFLCG